MVARSNSWLTPRGPGGLGTSVTDGHNRGGAAARTGVGRGRGRGTPAPAAGVSRERLSDVVAQHAGAPPPAEMLVSGIIPPLADAYFQRLETGVHLKAGLFPGETVVLTHGEETQAAPVAQGGTGKTQLAVEFTHALRSARAVDV